MHSHITGTEKEKFNYVSKTAQLNVRYCLHICDNIIIYSNTPHSPRANGCIIFAAFITQRMNYDIITVNFCSSYVLQSEKSTFTN